MRNFPARAFRVENTGDRRRRMQAFAANAAAAVTAQSSAAQTVREAAKSAVKPAAKKHKKRGRPRIKGRIREANGRISRAAEPVSRLALEARAFHSRLTLEQAADPRAETYLGRLAIIGREGGISGDQYEAAQNFLKLRNDYQRSLLSPGAYYEATGIRIDDSDDSMAEYADWAARVKKRYAGALKFAQEAQMENGGENIYAALQYVLIDGRELPYMLTALRLLLNALRRFFAYGDSERAKPRPRLLP